mmetsp:Transcript_8447/g.17901  ORF Transcript_8447/g.17901 Transcript_8447/m.17901 type:complete len:320 (+) Transcript_8447:331-1290(+)
MRRGLSTGDMGGEGARRAASASSWRPAPKQVLDAARAVGADETGAAKATALDSLGESGLGERRSGQVVAGGCVALFGAETNLWTLPRISLWNARMFSFMSFWSRNITRMSSSGETTVVSPEVEAATPSLRSPRNCAFSERKRSTSLCNSAIKSSPSTSTRPRGEDDPRTPGELGRALATRLRMAFTWATASCAWTTASSRKPTARALCAPPFREDVRAGAETSHSPPGPGPDGGCQALRAVERIAGEGVGRDVDLGAGSWPGRRVQTEPSLHTSWPFSNSPVHSPSLCFNQQVVGLVIDNATLLPSGPVISKSLMVTTA